MNCCYKSLILALVVGLLSTVLPGQQPTTTPAVTAGPAAKPLVNDVHRDLATSALLHARLVDLPAGVVLKAGDVAVEDKELADDIAKAPKDIRDQLKQNGFFVMEQLAAKKLLLKEARAEAAKSGTDLSKADDSEIIQGHLKKLADTVKVTDAEITDFYKQNADAVNGAKFEEVKPQIEKFLLKQKVQAAIAEYIRTLGKRHAIEVSAAWAKQQAVLARDNPADKARDSGKPSLVDFGSKGCKPCDMLAPILETMKEKYDGKANVLFISVVKEQILAARYGIESIPVQIFFDKDGKEVFRHIGFWPQAELEKKLAELGIK